ncbi:uncharacterized protein ATNIH1004_002668 [Aspergillus tanneri]|uniref:Uncharacterized protein n=1 Tax=Aspergillus tanneri TaxID=1220188 RepID=A0A5M9MT03_9EURO|nr:uncharacterized protein ATNIH1004_002668 [Aspergillus tanneri]KAA8649988.1 hypothetical protein ATNIH1004_002668 [Aspergillus tanneri]
MAIPRGAHHARDDSAPPIGAIDNINGDATPTSTTTTPLASSKPTPTPEAPELLGAFVEA